MKEVHWWIVSFLLAILVASTEVYVCGWFGGVYDCQLISDPPPPVPEEEIELPDEYLDFLLDI